MNGEAWTDADIERLRKMMTTTDLPIWAMAERLGRTPRAVGRKYVKLKLSLRVCRADTMKKRA